ncbi:hypothetical protein KAW50_07155, partial [candidate division WOR-3 bacterium]|nr:hypothetical protein [candidate division WOR-3 bacterium]
MKRWGFLMVLGACSLYGQWENPDKRITNYPSYSDYGSRNNAWTIAVQDSFVHIVWEHRDGTNPGELYYVQSIDYGATFGPHQQLTTQNSHCPSICVFDSFVHIAWNDIRNGNYEIYYNRSSDYGASWDIDNF